MTLRERIQLLADAVKEAELAAHTLWVQWSPTMEQQVSHRRLSLAVDTLTDALQYLDTAMLRLPDADQNVK